MVNLAKSEEGIPIAPAAFDRDPWLFNVENGTLDLRTGTLRPHRAEDFLTKLAPVAYEPQATAPTFAAFLTRIFANDPAMLGYLQQAIGYSLTGQTIEQCWFLLHGIGANGKSTLLRTLIDLLGDYATWTPTQTLLAKRGEGIDNDLARLRGARFVDATETDGGRRLAEELVKRLTGGDKVAARFLYGEFFEFAPEFKLWLATNHKPEIRGTDQATWRRVRLIPFTVTIPDAQQDRGLLEKLRGEFPGILRWMVEGRLAWQRGGLGLPDAVREATQEYRASMDVIGQFFAECCAAGAKATAKAADLYRAYGVWCERNREHPESRRRFGEALSERGYQRGRDVLRHVVWKGIRLRSEGSEPNSGKLF
jgi:putative DNA primase/helicase